MKIKLLNTLHPGLVMLQVNRRSKLSALIANVKSNVQTISSFSEIHLIFFSVTFYQKY